VDKLQFVLYIKDIPTVEGRNAELALWRRSPEEAEKILVQAGLFYRAIRMHVRLYNWDRCVTCAARRAMCDFIGGGRALILAITHKTHVETVLGYRQRYLQVTCDV
jgi:intraflagellar transport protein 80